MSRRALRRHGFDASGVPPRPRALRDASARFGWLGEPSGPKGFFEISSGKTLPAVPIGTAGMKMIDVGDVDVSLVQPQDR